MGGRGTDETTTLFISRQWFRRSEERRCTFVEIRLWILFISDVSGDA